MSKPIPPSRGSEKKEAPVVAEDRAVKRVTKAKDLQIAYLKRVIEIWKARYYKLKK